MAKHRVIGEPALATMFVGFCYYGYISNEGGNPHDKRLDLSLFCLLGLFAKVGRERLQPFCESHVVREQFPHFSVNSSDWMRFTILAGMGGRLLARQNGAGLGLAEGITDEAGRVGMCQESAVDSHYVTVLGSADRELGVLADDDSKGSDE